jgi:hypothetical protein
VTIQDLIDALQEQADRLGGDVPIRVAVQPSWPLRGTVCGVVANDEITDPDVEPERIVWIATSERVDPDESPYAPRDVWGQC